MAFASAAESREAAVWRSTGTSGTLLIFVSETWDRISFFRSAVPPQLYSAPSEQIQTCRTIREPHPWTARHPLCEKISLARPVSTCCLGRTKFLLNGSRRRPSCLAILESIAQYSVRFRVDVRFVSGEVTRDCCMRLPCMCLRSLWVDNSCPSSTTVEFHSLGILVSCQLER